jgi:hypothetical protein
MNISREDARQSLTMVENTSTQTGRSIAAAYSGPLLILWGLVWVTAFIGTHLFLHSAWYIWMVLDTVGAAGTALICRWRFRAGIPTKSSDSKRVGWSIFWFWTLLLVYIIVWLFLLSPVSGLQLNAFICTAAMFAYVMMGLWWRQCRFLLWLGLTVTVVTLIGFYLIPLAFYCLWMAVAGGGTMLGTGLYIWFCWR